MVFAPVLALSLAAVPRPPEIWSARTIGCQFEFRTSVTWSDAPPQIIEEPIQPPLVDLYTDIDSTKGTAQRQGEQWTTQVVASPAGPGLGIQDKSVMPFGSFTLIHDTEASRKLRPGYRPAIKTTHMAIGQAAVTVQEFGWCRILD